MIVERFSTVTCPQSSKRWLLSSGGHEVHCNVVVQPDGTVHYAAWVDAESGPISSGREPNIRLASLAAKQAATKLMADLMEAESLHGLTASPERHRRLTGVVATRWRAGLAEGEPEDD